MSDELKFPDAFERGGQHGGEAGPGEAQRDALSEPLIRLVRDAYAPPVAAGDVYWNSLEQRIMARASAAGIATGDGQWWSVLGAWAQTGLIAAAAIFAVAGAINQRFNDNDSQFVYESLVQPVTPEILSAPTDLLSAPEGSRSDATLIYVLSH